MIWPGQNPGELQHAITIKSQTTVAGTSGPKASWVDFARVYARIAPLSSSRATDAIASGQTVSELPITITLNWIAGITSDMHVQANGGTYIIREVVNVNEMNVTLDLICIALKNNQ